ncbi:fimbrial protein [Stenotrophomonas aracearum]|jgi:pilus assembly protein CpaE|uniref:Fimbrial protein n=1 Tax=Stenotrophomonas aracearum TaxID=3003272 RepID=A0ABY9Y8K0_9GAMM|nr:fimbrial protein [Stenotrophomonas sp. A5588]WNH47194.1 fimbrial protein [Stenotrophomonas sp. A5588]
MTASLRLLQPTPPPLTLVLYAPARELALVLEARLPVGLHVHWQDSALPPAALEVHRRSGPCVVLLDFRRDAAAASGDLARSLQRTLPDLPLVAVGSTAPGQDEGIVAAVRTGLRDILDLESTTADIDSVLRRAAALSAPSPRAPVQAAPQAQLVLLLGVRAGVGCSTLAAHLGVLAQQCSSGDADDTSGELLPTATTLLLDLGQPAGDTALYLNLDSQFHVEDALRHASLIDGTLARTAMARHGGGLTLLGQAAGSDGGPIPDPAVLVQRLRTVFDTVLCDLGGLALRQVPRSLFNSADAIWLVADQAIGTLVSLDLALKQLEAMGLRDDRVQLLINRYQEDDGLVPAQIAGRFGLPLLATLPDCHRLRGSANHGHLLLQDAPRDPYVRALAPLLLHLDHAAAQTAPRSWREKLALALGGLQWKTK